MREQAERAHQRNANVKATHGLPQSEDWRRKLVNWSHDAAGNEACANCSMYSANRHFCVLMMASTLPSATCKRFHR